MAELTELYHDTSYMQGIRVLMLRGRLKDGTPNRVVNRVSYSEDDFKVQYVSLLERRLPKERIYASAGFRNPKKAIRLFRERQLAAEYDQSPTEFYKNLENGWVSALMAPTSQAEKVWMFDCDTLEQEMLVKYYLSACYDRPRPPYWYDTKSGKHCIVQPFDKSRIHSVAQHLLRDNPLMLWAY